MNYFDLFEIPISFYPDQEQVRKKYLENSRNTHPDIAHGQDEMESMELTALNNKAYSTLKVEEKRINYILQELYPAENKVALPPDFLMEMMEANEEMMDAKMEGNEIAIAKLREGIEQMQLDLKTTLNTLLKEFDFSDLSGLDAIREIGLRLNYLKRLL